MVATIQKPTTMRLWARTQRVSEDKVYLRGFVWGVEDLRASAGSSIGDLP
jgi:hypothetical protein